MKTDALVLPTTWSRGGDFVALAKPRLNFLVVVTAAVGYYLGVRDGFDARVLAATIIGTALVAGGASAFNQIYERNVDALMHRTRLRPLPDGRVGVAEALAFATVLTIAGLGILALGTNVVAATAALATIASYAVIYTPLKLRTSFATVVGAVPGALPPVIGWAAARGSISLEGWTLFAMVFLWQIPHFLAIAWMYRDDYARAGFPFLPVIEPAGDSTARQVLLYGSALIPVSLVPAVIGLATPAYLVGALLLGVLFFALCVRFAMQRDRASARQLFLGSIVYLPLIWALLVATKA